MMKKLIINFTPTGMIPQKSQTPHVPILPDEIISDVRADDALGITRVYLHICDEKTHQPCYKKETYARIIGC